MYTNKDKTKNEDTETITLEEHICSITNVNINNLNEIELSDIKFTKTLWTNILGIILQTHQKSLENLNEDQDDQFNVQEALSDKYMKTFWTTDLNELIICISINKTVGIYKIPKQEWEVDYENVQWH